MVPGAAVGVVFLVGECVIVAQPQPLFGTENGHAVNLAARLGDVFLEPPPQPAIEIQLSLARVVVFINAGQSIIAGAVQMRVFQRNGLRVIAQIACVQIDDIAEHRVAPFFGVEGQHFAHCAMFAEGIEQIFGVVAVIDPLARCGVVDGVDCKLSGIVLAEIMINLHDLVCQDRGCLIGGGGQQDHFGKAQGKVVADRAVNLDHILGQDHGNRPLGEGFGGCLEKLI